MLRFVRTLAVVLILLASAVAGGTRIVRQRYAERNMLDAGTAVLAAQPITVGSPDASVVNRVLIADRDSVTAGAPVVTITHTAAGGGPRVQQLKAPAAGIVTEINIAPGQIARAGEPIVTLYDPSQLTFRVDVPLETLRELRLGMTAYVSGPGLPGRIATMLEEVEPKVGSGGATAPSDLLTVVLRPDPAALPTVRTLVPGLRFHAVVDTTTAVGATPAVNSA
ncbi:MULTISPECIES: HlyD family efflux transporter periplasmic adaptor subunit [unclassified Actinoplanes]|uniref:HlyD family efflux transporter periplasmic adaptor subunit n=1 Tax=unclassified Actinoplanes TaxID=2626549 RepID=UPI0002EBC63C|nr:MULTISPECIES: HlyD family efflux transporter periplasmic adaptor subunit [unclassified Actinoplanes]